jgi:succinate dehydrogenase (ubiquinone) cytochrome b560 subunit
MIPGFYAYGAAYLAAPAFGWHLDTATLAEAFGSLSDVSKFAIKTTVALPFTYHSWNGIRHLM